MHARPVRTAVALASLIVGASLYGYGSEFPKSHIAVAYGEHAVLGYFIGGMQMVFFEGDANALNEHLADLAKDQNPKPIVVLHDGALTARSPWTPAGEEKTADWSTTYRPGSAAPRVHVFLDGRIERDRIVLPEGVEASDSDEAPSP